MLNGADDPVCPSLLPQQSSWGCLLITLEATCKLLTSLAVHPAFIDVLRAFGQKTDFEDDSVSGFHFQMSADSEGYGMLVTRPASLRKPDSRYVRALKLGRYDIPSKAC